MNDSEGLPSCFDVIVLGTGLSESIVAAACAKSGKTVLHLDRNGYYGGVYSSFNLKTINELVDDENVPSETISTFTNLEDNEEFIHIAQRNFMRNFQQEWHIHNGGIEKVNLSSEAVDPMFRSFEDNTTKFNIDMCPKLLLSRGALVKLLCASKVNKYCEFQLVDRFLRYVSDESGDSETFVSNFRAVPFSRADIFQTNELTRPEKRRLMKFLSSCQNWNENDEEIQDFLEKPFTEFLNSQELTENLKNIIMDTVGILQPNAQTNEALKAVCRFLNSMGMYGNSPFLWTMYGSCDLPQGFCRSCAVHGGIYCLKKRIDGIIVSNERVVAVVIDGERIKCEYLVMDSSYVPDRYVKQVEINKSVQRAVVISDGSLLPDDAKEHLSVVNLTRLNHGVTTRLLELGRTACVCPKNFYVSHLISSSDESSSKLAGLIHRLWSSACVSIENGDKRPRMFWSVVFDIENVHFHDELLPENMRVFLDDMDSLDCTSVAENSERIFKELWPEAEFFPVVEESDETVEESDEIVADEVVGDSAGL